MHRKKQRVPLTISHRSGWRDYQAALKRTAASRKRHRRLFRAGCLLILTALAGWAAAGGLTGLKARFGETALPPTQIVAPSPTADPTHGLLDKLKLQPMLASAQLMNSREDYFYITADDQQLCVDTSLDLNLQNYLYGKMNTAHARQIAMVVLEPDSGRVKTMVGYDKHDPALNTCLDSDIPAASVFKIVTAAAAIDTFDFSPETVFLFNGAKHTLYKRQLLEKKNRYTNPEFNK